MNPEDPGGSAMLMLLLEPLELTAQAARRESVLPSRAARRSTSSFHTHWAHTGHTHTHRGRKKKSAESERRGNSRRREQRGQSSGKQRVRRCSGAARLGRSGTRVAEITTTDGAEGREQSAEGQMA